MNVFAPHGDIHAQGPWMPVDFHPHCCTHNPLACPRSAPNDHPPCRLRCPATNLRPPELIYTISPACPYRQTSPPLTV